MKIVEIAPNTDWTLSIISSDGYKGSFDVTPYLRYEAFKELKTIAEFMKVSNGGYFVEWDCGADLSADSIEAHWKVIGKVSNMALT